MTLEIIPVSNKRLLKAFIKVPWPIYRDDGAWRAPLVMERLMALSPKSPVFDHLDWQAWIARRDGRPVGRITAQIDALHQAQHDEGTGFFGLIEGEDDPDLFDTLFKTAEDWLRHRGMQRIIGPINLNINQEIGLLTEGHDTPPYVMMGHARPYYRQRIEALGYRPCQHLLAYEAANAFEEPRAIAAQRKRLARRIALRPLDRARKAADLERMRSIFNDAWADNWGFVPFTEREFQALGQVLLAVVPNDLIWLAEIEGEAVGFIVMLPNINDAVADLNGRLLPWGWAKLLWRLKARLPSSGRVPLMGVRRQLQDGPLGAGVAMSLIHRTAQAALGHGITTSETSWILEDNKGMRAIMERIGGVISKRYTVYEKSLVPP
ncbi:MAG: N-acetyltransferase [Gammaproteobacteria bacterium]|nr:N-acetyltransferase [Gammaproteobacteria bacterium]